MKIYIIRHAQVDMTWPKVCNSAEFDKACNEYDNSRIIETGLSELDIKCNLIYVSSLLRSKETAALLFPNKDYLEETIGEVPLKSYKDSISKKPLWIWNVWGRMQWYFNNSRQEEGRNETIRRCNQIITRLADAGEDCILVTHGFFMRVLVKCLRKQGYHVKGNSLAVNNLQVVIVEK